MSHAKLAPSSAHRWMACPGSVALCEGLPEQTSEYAAEGTVAHEVAARCLESGTDADEYLDTVADGHRVTAEMVDAVQYYVDAVRGQILMEADAELLVEQKVTVTSTLYGTADALLFGSRTLHVFDLKFGSGVFVDVEDNLQLQIYAIGALLTFAAKCLKITQVALHIVQPRYYGGAAPWRTKVYQRADLEGLHYQLIDAAKATEAKDAPLQSGDHCRWCKAKTICPRLRADAVEAAQHVFAPPAEAVEPPRAELLAPADIARLLPLFDRVEEWMSAVRKEAFERAQSGQPIDGYKLVQKIGLRRWTDEQAARLLLEAHGVEPYAAPSLVSPAQAEKALAKVNKKLRELVEPLTFKPATGTVLVPETDKRPALSPGAVFAPIEES